MGKITKLIITQYASSLTSDLYKLVAIGYGIGATFNRDLMPVAIVNGVACLLNRNLAYLSNRKKNNLQIRKQKESYKKISTILFY
jgi:hypothetical protein